MSVTAAAVEVEAVIRQFSQGIDAAVTAAMPAIIPAVQRPVFISVLFVAGRPTHLRSS
jgi:hypothetical protein